MTSQTAQRISRVCGAPALAAVMLFSAVASGAAEELTMLQAYERGITSLVGEGPSIAFPEAGSLIGGHWAAMDHPTAAYIHILSAEMEMAVTCTSTPSFRIYYRGTPLTQEHPYRLEGQFGFREEMGEGDLLSDSAFVAHSNRPVYWNQTFEFRLSNLSELRDPSPVELTSWGLAKQYLAVPNPLWPVARRTPRSAEPAPCRGSAMGFW
jgi:hypothetical protein